MRKTNCCRAALLALAAAAALSAAPAARASFSLPGVETYGETEDSPAQAFLRRHFTKLIVAVPVAAGIIIILIMGPSDVSDALLRVPRRRRSLLGDIFFGGGGFGSGGFGGGSGKDPWL